MRDTGPISKVIGSNGDSEASVAQVGEARKQLGILKNQMTQGNLDVGARTVNYPDGTVIRASVVGGVSKVNIYVPQPESPPEELPVVQIPQPHFPEPPVPPPRYVIQAIRGTIASDAAAIYPFLYNGMTINAPSRPGQVLLLGKAVRIGISTSGQATLLPLAVVDASTYALVSDQPEITGRVGQQPAFPAFSFSQLSGPAMLSPKDLKTLLGLESIPKDLTFLDMNPAWVDTQISLSATMNDGSSAANDFTLTGNALVGAAVIGLTPTSITINGTPVSLGDSVPCPGGSVDVVISVTGGATSWVAVVQVFMLFAGPRASGGGLQTGGIYDCSWEEGAGSFLITSTFTLAAVDLSGVISGSGTSVSSGVLTIGDGYGNPKEVPISITVNLS